MEGEVGLNLYAIEYTDTVQDGRQEKYTRIEVVCGRFIDLIKAHKCKRGFEGIYSI